MDLITGGITGILNAGRSIYTAVAGDKGAEQAAIHGETMATMGQYASEFRKIENRTWFDAFVDGMNRLVRPTIAFGVIGLFAHAFADPISFTEAMTGVTIIPTEMWYVLGAIIGFYFGARELQKSRDKKSAVQRIEAVKQVVSAQKEIRSMRQQPKWRAAEISDRDYEAEMADTSKPLSNAAIMKWNQLKGDK